MMTPVAHPQAGKLAALIRAAGGGKVEAESGLLFASRAGLALVNAAFDLFECDDLYDLAGDMRRDLVAAWEERAVNGRHASARLDRAG